ncbi:MAG: FHA domain-containing protein [Nitrospirae bacterium]|nr:MAG: FHA domain-containing protein [Nitrospirota bacterium]
MVPTLLETDETLGSEQGRVKFALIHLSGSRRGQTQEFGVERLTIGTDPGNDLAFDPARDAAVSLWHAELSVENCELVLRDKGSQGGTFVNRQCVAEVILQDGDLLTLGQGGPQLRVRIRPEAYAHCKPFRDILCDCRDIAKSSKRGWVVSAALFFRHLFSDLAFHATVPVRLLAGTILLLPIVLLGGLLYSQFAARSAYERQVSVLLGQIETGRVSQVAVEQQVREARKRVGELMEEQQKEAETLAVVLQRKQQEQAGKAELAALKKRLRAIEAERTAAERIISTLGQGVAFIQGKYGFAEKGTGRVLCYEGMDASGAPLLDAEGHPLFTLEEGKPPVIVHFTGTGFVADARGFMLTNRHVARMWETDPAAKELIATGLEPRLLMLRGFFPGLATPFDLRTIKVSEQADVALLAFDPGEHKLPVLGLATEATKVTAGEPILLSGYPTGFDALMARADQITSSEIMQQAGEDADRFAQELANHGLIRPLATQGHIGDVVADRLVYDAQTTFGGSGGPVFNLRGEVIAVNSMILRRFGGANFGVPIRFGIDLLRKNAPSG